MLSKYLDISIEMFQAVDLFVNSLKKCLKIYFQTLFICYNFR
nr:MAG TPA: hypothetical protein [Caudoviricetes sp.]DAS04503.1 MAG TPA: hypothetical protein [Caudoviricetes sp.]